MVRFARSVALMCALSGGFGVQAMAQVLPLVFTVPLPERTPSEPTPQLSVLVEERGLALWSGTATDFGIGTTLAGSYGTVRSVMSSRFLPVGDHARPTFQQIEVIRPLLSIGATTLAGGGGIRQEWDGTQVLIGRLLVRSDSGRGTVHGSMVMERATASALRHDTADMIMSVGWSRRIGRRSSIGIESVGQDLEGLWNPAEADGGARLLIGPSIHAESASRHLVASLTAGPVMHRVPTAQQPIDSFARYPSAGHHFGMFVSASWAPSLRR
jgi:hypothetical protein